jgi:hypothetical protein
MKNRNEKISALRVIALMMSHGHFGLTAREKWFFLKTCMGKSFIKTREDMANFKRKVMSYKF